MAQNTPPPHLPGTGELLDTATVAELLSCTSRTVTNLIQRGHLPAVRLGPGRSAYRVSAAALLDFVTRYGYHSPEDVADSSGPLPDFTPAPALLVETRSPDGLRLVTPYRPPDPGQES